MADVAIEHDSRSFKRTPHAGRIAVLALAGAAMLAGPVAAGSSPESASLDRIQSDEALKPGEWVWAPGVAPAGPMLIYVDLSRQRATVYRNGVRIGATTISSGKKGHVTPTGTFPILERAAVHHSNKYDEASMPFTERLTWDGVALHAGGVPGYPESHGCVHLPYGFAKALFSATHRGVKVIMAGSAAQHTPTPEGTLLVPDIADTTGNVALPIDDAAFSWKPELAPIGPISLIVSKTDQIVVVLRNGVEIGRAAAEIDDVSDDDSGSHVITLTDWPDGKTRLVYVASPGHDDDIAEAYDEATLGRIHVAKAFLDNVKSQMKPGATILMTDAPLVGMTTRLPLPAISCLSLSRN